MRNLLFWGLFPILLPQALYVRKTAPRFGAAAGPVTGSVGSGKPVRLIAIGDSIVAGVGAETLDGALVGQTAKSLAHALDARVEWQAIGKVGLNSAKVLDQLVPCLPRESANFMIVSVGVNDITSLTTVPAWRRNLHALLASLVEHSPGATIAVAGIPPLHGFPLLPEPLRAVTGLRGRSFDNVGQRVVRQFASVVHVPVDFDPDPAQFAADGYHPSPESYREFGAAMSESLLAGQPVSLSGSKREIRHPDRD